MNRSETHPFAQEGYQLMGVAFEVYRHLGGGLSEETYQESMEIELEMNRIIFRSKNGIPVFYKARRLKKRYVPDLIVFRGLIVELKAVTQLETNQEGQLLNYLRITKQPVGYLLNFGPTDKLQWKRFIISSVLNDRHQLE